MAPEFSIAPVRTGADLNATARLLEAYAASLPVDLAYQDFSCELAALPGKYAPPAGRLLLARGGAGAAIGCVGLRPISAARSCEMKRLFVLPASQGLGIGRALTEALIAEGRRLGYAELRLDTLPTMVGAKALYEKLGFERIAAYHTPTPTGTVFMTLIL